MKAVFEKIPENPQSEITAFLYDEVAFDAPWHYHPQCELTCILEGKGLRYVGNNISAFEEMDLVLLGGNLPHCWKKTSEGGRAKSIVFQWDEEIFPKVIDLTEIRKILSIASRGIKFSSNLTRRVLPLMKKIVEENDWVYIRFLEILEILAREKEFEILAGASYSADISNESNDRLSKILNYISENYQQKISLSEMAGMFHMTEPSFSRFFSQHFQKSFTVYLNEYRISRATRMLIETDYQVAHIGYACGYESLSFFYTQFRKFKKISPLKYRRKYRDKMSIE